MSWWARAACSGVSVDEAEKAFGTGAEQQEFVASYCDHCKVTSECWEERRDEHGVAGGKTQVQRSKALGAKRAARARQS